MKRPVTSSESDGAGEERRTRLKAIEAGLKAMFPRSRRPKRRCAACKAMKQLSLYGKVCTDCQHKRAIEKQRERRAKKAGLLVVHKAGPHFKILVRVRRT